MSERPERELEDMEDRADRLGDEIDQARDDWERKKGDPQVPGAPEPDEDENVPPEADEPA